MAINQSLAILLLMNDRRGKLCEYNGACAIAKISTAYTRDHTTSNEVVVCGRFSTITTIERKKPKRPPSRHPHDERQIKSFFSFIVIVSNSFPLLSSSEKSPILHSS